MESVRASLVVLFLSLCGCAGGQRHAAAEPAEPGTTTLAAGAARDPLGADRAPPRPATAPAPGDDATAARGAGSIEVPSNGGAYVLHLTTPPDGWKRGTAFALDCWLADAAEPGRPLTDVALSFDAEMPEHQHGMNRTPRIERRAGGSFRIEGVYLHMPGWWDLHFDATRGAWTERTQLRIEVE